MMNMNIIEWLFYFNSYGKMVTGWKNIDGKEYNLDSNGKLKSNGTNDDDDGEYPDFRDSINKMLKRNQEECKQHKGDFDMGLSWFKSKVNHRAAWDIKLQGAWDEQVGETFDIKDENGNFRKFIYNGEVISAEELGNITYGYWGTATNYGPELLYIGGGYAANTAHSDDLSTIEKLKIKAGAMNDALDDSIYHCDDPDDHEAIKKGIDMYNEMNP